ncbi:AMP-binding protein, partial [Marinicrinis sediminis]
PELFAEQVALYPDELALVEANRHLTYRQLDAKAERLAQQLRDTGMGSEEIVAIAGERSMEMVVGMLAIVKAGGAYLPIDPSYPPDRVTYMLTHSGAKVLLMQPGVSLTVPTSIVSMVMALDEPMRADTSREDIQVDSLDAQRDTSPVHPHHLAYVMYTSGSTGRPKGVMVEHRNVIRLVKDTTYHPFERGERILQTGAPVFDA